MSSKLNEVLVGSLVAQLVGKGDMLLLLPLAHDVAAGEQEPQGQALVIIFLQHLLHKTSLPLSNQGVKTLVEAGKIFA